MRSSTLWLSSILTLAGSVHGAKLQMEQLMDLKVSHRESQKKAGAFKQGKYASKVSSACTNGYAGEYMCSNIDMLDFLSHEDMGSTEREGNDVWGWVSADGREFATVGQSDGTAFVEVLPSGELVYLARLPPQTVSSIWRDIKIIKDHAYIGSEAAGHGIQIFDMTKLLEIEVTESFEPVTYSTTDDLTAWFSFGGGRDSSHNIVANAETDMIYGVGTNRAERCAAGLWMVDVSDPANPVDAGCAAQDGYVHDAQCVVYSGPDSTYTGQEICFNFNEDTLTIVDVTNKANPVQLSRTAYPGASYTHQGWLVDTDTSYLLLDDELDELDGAGEAANGNTTTFIFDISSLAAPVLTGIYQSPVRSIDHNQYTVNGITYQANYNSGLRMVDVSSVSTDPTGASFQEIGFFDVHPEDDAVGGIVEFSGTWSVYPYFPSGNLVLNSIERGLFSLKYTG